MLTVKSLSLAGQLPQGFAVTKRPTFFNVYTHNLTNLSIRPHRTSSLQQEKRRPRAALTEVRPRTQIALESVMVTTATTAAPLIEKHTIGYVPPEDRHGKTRPPFP